MQTKSVFIGAGCLLLLMIIFASCIPKNARKLKSKVDKQPVQNVIKEKNIDLLCSFNGTINGHTDDVTKQEYISKIANEFKPKRFRFNPENDEITIVNESNLQKSNAMVSPDLILFKTIFTNNNLIGDYLQVDTITTNYQIDRKTLDYVETGKFEIQGNYEPSITWRFIGSCKRIAADTSGNKI